MRRDFLKRFLLSQVFSANLNGISTEDMSWEMNPVSGLHGGFLLFWWLGVALTPQPGTIWRLPLFFSMTVTFSYDPSELNIQRRTFLQMKSRKGLQGNLWKRSLSCDKGNILRGNVKIGYVWAAGNVWFMTRFQPGGLGGVLRKCAARTGSVVQWLYTIPLAIFCTYLKRQLQIKLRSVFEKLILMFLSCSNRSILSHCEPNYILFEMDIYPVNGMTELVLKIWQTGQKQGTLVNA